MESSNQTTVPQKASRTAPVMIALALLIFIFNAPITAQTPLKTEKIVTGLDKPLYLCSPPNDSDRIFILEQWTGQILIYKNDSLYTRPFLDIGDQIITGSERGLLGLVFHPNYSQNGYFYINYTRSGDGTTVIARYTVSSDPDSADAGSESVIMTVDQPYANHNAGMLAFGPNDGYLYFGLGDGGDAGDPQDRAQDLDSLLGKMIRIDVDGGTPYGIPPTNPFIDSANARDEIWSYGWRNPWRFSFDSETGDMWIGDVGQYDIEEIDFEPASSEGGGNYGWRCYEGSSTFNTSNCDLQQNFNFPIYEYFHNEGRCSVTGGYVYRGCAVPDLSGTYFFGDYCSGEIWSFRYDGGSMTDFTDRTAELDPADGSIDLLSSFGVDALGELYILDYSDGDIYKIVPDGVASGCLLCGDANLDSNRNLLDITYLINCIYKGGECPSDIFTADVDGSGSLNLLDITNLINYLYKNGPELNCL